MDDFFAFMLVCFAGGLMMITLYAYFKAIRRRFNPSKEIPGEAEERLMQRLENPGVNQSGQSSRMDDSITRISTPSTP